MHSFDRLLAVAAAICAPVIGASIALSMGMIDVRNANAANVTTYRAAIVEDINAEDDCPAAIIVDGARLPLGDFARVDSGPVCLY